MARKATAKQKKKTVSTKTSTVKKPKKPLRKKAKAKANKPKAKPVKKASAKRVKKVSQKETLTLGLLQHEIDEILDNQNLKNAEKTIEQNLVKALAKLLPEKEAISANKKDPSQITVNSTTTKQVHSPFVLDLSAMIEKKREKEAKKRTVLSRFHSVTKKHREKPTQTLKVTTKTKKQTVVITEKLESKEKVVIAQHEDPIQVTAPSHKNKKHKSKSWQKQFTIKPWHYNFNLPLFWYRPLAAYIAICIIIILPIKVFGQYNEIRKSQEQIVNYATTAYEDLKVASTQLANDNPQMAQTSFSTANQNFVEAGEKLNSMSTSLKTILNLIPINSPNLADAEHLLDAGEQVSGLGQSITNLFTNFKSQTGGYLTDHISTLQTELSSISPKLDRLNYDLQQIRPEAVPDDKKEIYGTIQEYLGLLNSDIQEFHTFTGTLNSILGQKHKKRYLFVFQNNNELRPTGGFMGSMALVDVDRGQITNIEIPGGGTYDVQGQLHKKLISPYQLHVVNPLWQLQDSNWFADFPTSAEKIMWFYEHSGGPTVDGVVAINVSFLPELMKVSGPIYLPEYNKTFNNDNIVLELQKAIEIDYDNVQENQPKKILSYLAPELINSLFDLQGEQLISLAKTIKTNLEQKEIQLYFKETQVQDKFSEYGWTGELLDSSKDYLAVINTNIGGGKTDAYIDQTLNLTTDVYNNGEIINTLEITRTHNGDLNNFFGKTSNLNYVRIYVPFGSQLISAQNFEEVPPEAFEEPEEHWQTDEHLQNIQGEVWVDPNTGTFINNEFNKTVFGNWEQVDPGETKTFIFKYRLPITLNLTTTEDRFSLFDSKSQSGFHSLFWQKQAGQQNTTYNLKFNLPYAINSGWTYPPELKNDKNSFVIESQSRADEMFAFILD
ncbi:DUF4012 domain-containing protein [Candidatus Falkowbacteria bacterium]|jgi:hypothetical protein|nr:DUF4012 domain-containing protein [Candidatus Falkowbacteria bacterium]MBT6573818.1 DUF4012 domain-containing protein [Candidatus Falkowbacteria bacterium]MBT7348754.1 DUF4012 domain-containing protein [Candidatus Falkowbacteria bacterium]MBT7500544.1 DUF4012 domain-containing protein [Candidatus Falkowbacteria bacterium]